MVRNISAAVTVALAATLAVSAGAKEVTLSAVNFVPNNNSFGKPFYEWVQRVNAKGKGLVQIDIKPSGSMSPFVMGNAIKNGVVDMANLPPTFYQNLLPVGDALKLMTKPPEERRKNGAWALLNKLHNEKVNAWYLTTWGYGVPFHLYLRDRQMKNLSLKGFKIRTTPVYRAFFRALGADLIQTKPADVYTMLERGAVDGYGWPVWDIKSFGWDKVTKYRVDPGFYQTASAIIMNLDKWKSLSKKAQDFLMAEAIKFQADFPKNAPELNKWHREQQRKAGVQVQKLSDEEAKKYIKLAYEAGWAEVIKLDPVNGPKLKKLLSD